MSSCHTISHGLRYWVSICGSSSGDNWRAYMLGPGPREIARVRFRRCIEATSSGTSSFLWGIRNIGRFTTRPKMARSRREKSSKTRDIASTRCPVDFASCVRPFPIGTSWPETCDSRTRVRELGGCFLHGFVPPRARMRAFLARVDCATNYRSVARRLFS